MKKLGKRLLAVALLISMSMGIVLNYLPRMWNVDASDSTTLDYSFTIDNQENIGTRLDNDFNVYRYGEVSDVSYDFTKMTTDDLANFQANEYGPKRTGSPSLRRINGETKTANNWWEITDRGLEPNPTSSSDQFFRMHIAKETQAYEVKFVASKGAKFGIDIGTTDYFGHNDAVDTASFGFSVQNGGTRIWMHGTDTSSIKKINGVKEVALASKHGGIITPTTALSGTTKWCISVNGRDVTVLEETSGFEFSFKMHVDHVPGMISLRANTNTGNQPTNSDSVKYSNVSVKYLDKTSATTVGEPSALATTTIPNTKNNNYLKLKDVAVGNQWTGKVALMTYMTEVANFTAEYEIFLGNMNIAGLIFGGEAGKFPISFDNDNTNDTGVMLWVDHNGQLTIAGAIKRNTTNYLGGTEESNDDYWPNSYMTGTASVRGKAITAKRHSSQENLTTTDVPMTIVVTVEDGLLTVYEKDTPEQIVTVELSDSYKDGYVSLYQHNHNTSFRSFKISEPVEEEVPAVNATTGQGFNKVFTEISGSADLDDEFDSYYFSSESSEPVKGEPSTQWSTKKDLTSNTAYQNDYLKPTHQYDGAKKSLLTYQSLIFKNVYLTTEYVPNNQNYGIMIAPEGAIATMDNGIRIYVEGNGTINIKGVIDAASGSATGGYVKVAGKNHLTGYSLSSKGYVAATSANGLGKQGKTYKLHVSISGNTMSVWLGEYSDYQITVTLTDDYQGGMVSLYSNGYNFGESFKSFVAQEMDNVEVVKDDKIFTQSFNTISSLDEITDCKAYTLASVEEQLAETTIDQIFKLDAGKLRSTTAERGNYDDTSNFGILTLTKKRYENFELKLTYQQTSDRYGVMFGTEEGEFAYTKKGNALIGNGGVFAYTEGEGYRNIKGSVDPKAFTSTDDAKKLLSRKKDDVPLESFTAFTDTSVEPYVATMRQRPIHTLTIRVVGGKMTMIVDNNELSRVTVSLTDYDGGYISLVTSASAADTHGAFLSLSVKELGADAKLETEAPEITEGFNSITTVEDMFDAYYLANVKESNKYEKVEVADRWFVNKDGFVSKTIAGSGIQINEGVDILTYKKQEFTDFELTYTFQQAYSRLGVIIGGDKDKYPLDYSSGKFTAHKSAMFYIEAEGKSVVKGHLHNYTSESDLWYRITDPLADGYTDAAGSAADNVSAKKVHEVKIVVKDKQLYVFLDGSKEATLYVKLGDNYKGGYVSLFSTANSNYGFGSFEISKKIKTELPKAAGTSSSGNTFVANFDSAKFDNSKFTTYYFDNVKGNQTGAMVQKEFDDNWTVANGKLTRTSKIANGSDASKVSVLTYEKPMTDFIVTYTYHQDTSRHMFMFGTEKGEYPLYEGQGGLQKPNGGVVLYPEYDIGEGGGIVALGEALPATTSHRPLRRLTVKGIDYYVKQPGVSYKGNLHTMTVAVINKQCYVYLDDYGLIDQFALSDDYKGGYISLASSGSGYGFDELQITNLSSVSANAVVSAEVPRHLTVQVGTASSALQLPQAVKVTLKNGNTVQAAVDWKNFNYDSTQEGICKYTGVVKTTDGIENPAMVGVELEIKVLETLPTTGANVKEWSFDTKDDMNDFSTTYLQDVEKGYITKDVPQWWVSQGGKLCRDEYRSVNGTDKENLAIFTYTGQTYKNFELEVDYSWSSTRMMVMFGSAKVGQYIDLKEMKSDKNPSAVFVEMEGVRNVIGNVRNTDYYRRTDTTISSARENGDRIPNYYNADNLASNKGTMRHMKIRVVGDKVSVWIGDHAEPFVATLTNYKGGYISLVSCSKGGMFDNLKITRLSDNLVDDPVENVKAIANGTMNLTIDESASTQLEIPTEVAPETFGSEDELAGKDTLAGGISTRMLLLSGSIVLSSLIAGALIILLALNKRRKGDAK